MARDESLWKELEVVHDQLQHANALGDGRAEDLLATSEARLR